LQEYHSPSDLTLIPKVILHTFRLSYRFKIPSVGNEFSSLSAKDAFGHILYLYESDMKKIKKIK
jgi:hypothetical protein